MILLALSDLHSRFPTVETLPDADAVLLAGDLTDFGVRQVRGWNDAVDFMRRMEKRYPALFWVPGNHDIEIGPGFFAGTCLLERTETLGDFQLTGIALSCCFDFPELKRYWTHMTDDPAIDAAAFDALAPADIVVSHSPPLRCLDDAKGTAIGSPGLRRYIERHTPRLVVCGHCHEGAFQGERGEGAEHLGKTLVINAALHYVTIEIMATSIEVRARQRL